MTKARSNAVAAAAKGDLIVGTGTNSSGILAVSANSGDTIVADSSTATGLRYTAGNPISNPVLNSAAQVWQRGTSISVAASTVTYTADRWQVATQANQACTISRQATGDTTNLPNIQYALRFQRNSGQTGTGGLGLGQSFESINSIPYAGKTVTLSFYARAGANYSPTSSVLTGQLYSGTGTDQNILTGFTGGVAVASTAPTLTTTWTRYSVTGTVGATATQLGLYFLMSPTGTAGTNDYYEITGVQIDIGSVALPFRTYAGTIQGELAACQRYFYKVENPFVATVNQSTSSTTGILPFPVVMRVAPTATYSSAGTFYVGGNSSGTASSVSTNTAKTFQLPIDFGRSGLTAWNSSFVSNNGTSTIEMSSEL